MVNYGNLTKLFICAGGINNGRCSLDSSVNDGSKAEVGVKQSGSQSPVDCWPQNNNQARQSVFVFLYHIGLQTISKKKNNK